MNPNTVPQVDSEEEQLSTVCEQGMFGELGIDDPTQQEVLEK